MAAPARQRSLIVPREHGAWGILLVPLVTGASVGLLHGGSAAGLAPLSIAALALFWLRTPVESWSGTSVIRARAPQEIALVRNAVLVLGAVSVAALVWLFWGGRNRGLLWIGAAAGAAFLLQAAVKRRRTAAQMIGSLGLTATAPAAYYVVTGQLGAIAWSLWAANFLFAANQIQFVQLRIHAARAGSRREKLSAGRVFFVGQIVLLAIVAAALPRSTVFAFLPILYRGFAWFVRAPRPLAIHALGKSELAYACVFGVLLIAALA